MRSSTDQLHRHINLPSPPRRIISLVPSQSELLWYLGLEKEVVGITKFCVHPQHWRKNKVLLGGTKQIKINLIAPLQPDLIIANKEENQREQIEGLTEQYPVWISDIATLDEALDMISRVSSLCGKPEEGHQLKTEIQQAFETLWEEVSSVPPLRTVYLIWRRPYMTIGGDTFIHDMLTRAGFANVFGARQRYPEITLDELTAAQPEVILLSSEPFPFKAKHIEEIRDSCPHSSIVLADGELFSWYGSRLLQSPSYFRTLYRQVQGR